MPTNLLRNIPSVSELLDTPTLRTLVDRVSHVGVRELEERSLASSEEEDAARQSVCLERDLEGPFHECCNDCADGGEDKMFEGILHGVNPRICCRL